ncbi:MAG: hypothetical protein RIB70_08050 [Roseitalea porphyridii]|uniref:hypothetical protein n=1 Tax=Roseitalea porphyridii TaxID=1852022 RepID=UPI0032EE1E81
MRMSHAVKWAITLLMGATIFRAQTILFLPQVQMFGGIAPDGWFGPWLSDTIIGFSLPVMLYLFWTRHGVAVWAHSSPTTPLGRSITRKVLSRR